MRRTLITIGLTAAATFVATWLVGTNRSATSTSRPAAGAVASATRPFDPAAALAIRVREVAAETRALSVTRAISGSDNFGLSSVYTMHTERLLRRVPPARLLWSAPHPAEWVVFQPSPFVSPPDPPHARAFIDRTIEADGPSRTPDVADVRFPITEEWIEPLLRDADPKVRSWAIILLARLGRIDVLPKIAAMADDRGVTFPPYEQTPPRSGIRASDERSYSIDGRFEHGRYQPGARTVGDVALVVVDYFLDRSPATPGPRDRQRRPIDAAGLVPWTRAFVAARDPERSFVAFRVALDRAKVEQFCEFSDRVEAQLSPARGRRRPGPAQVLPFARAVLAPRQVGHA